jgi:hypothetical protein
MNTSTLHHGFFPGLSGSCWEKATDEVSLRQVDDDLTVRGFHCVSSHVCG